MWNGNTDFFNTKVTKVGPGTLVRERLSVKDCPGKEIDLNKRVARRGGGE